MGLKPGSRSRDRTWRPPFVCFSPDAAHAYRSSNEQTPITEPMDLWQTDTDLMAEHLPGWEALEFNDEVRIYQRLPARALWFVGTREPDTKP